MSRHAHCKPNHLKDANRRKYGTILSFIYFEKKRGQIITKDLYFLINNTMCKVLQQEMQFASQTNFVISKIGSTDRN